jgi:hypothetical protein
MVCLPGEESSSDDLFGSGNDIIVYMLTTPCSKTILFLLHVQREDDAVPSFIYRVSWSLNLGFTIRIWTNYNGNNRHGE